jgi:hypothetical protein
VLGDAVAVHRPAGDCAQDEHVERPGQQIR